MQIDQAVVRRYELDLLGGAPSDRHRLRRLTRNRSKLSRYNCALGAEGTVDEPRREVEDLVGITTHGGERVLALEGQLDRQPSFGRAVHPP